MFEDQKLSKTTVLRIAAEGGGCSGIRHTLNFEETKDSEIDETQNLVVEFDGFKSVIDKKSLLFMDGTTIDYLQDADKRGFVFENPNATGCGGCGQ